MAEKIGEIYIESFVKGAIREELHRIKNEGHNAANSLKTMYDGAKRGFRDLAIAAGAVTAAITAIALPLVRAASAAEETRNKFNVTFQGITEAAQDVARELQTAYGLSIQESERLLSGTGDLLTGFGFTREAALDLSGQVQRLAVDLASFTNLEGGSARASEILTKAMLGERDALVSLGVKISEDDLKRRAQSEGIRLVNGQLDNQTRAQLTLRMVTEQSANAVGDFARSQDSFANKSRVLQSRIEDLKTELGQRLLPAATKLVEVFTKLAQDEGFKHQLEGLVRVISAVISGMAGLLNIFRQATAEVTSETEQLARFTRSATSAQRAQYRSVRDEIRTLTGEIRVMRTTGSQFMDGRSIQERTARLRELRAEMQRLISTAGGQTGTTGTGGTTRPPGGTPPPTGGTKPKQEAGAVAGFDIIAEYERQSMTSLQIVEQRNQKELETLRSLKEQELITQEQYNAAVQQMDQNTFNARVQQWQDGIQIASGIVGQLGAIFSQMAQNEMREIQNRVDAEIKALNKATKDKEKFYKATIKDKEKLDEALAQLEEERAAKEQELKDKAEAEMKKAQLDAFYKQQAINILNSVMNTALAVTKMLSSVPPPGNFVLAGIVGTMGAIQTALIAQQKPPALASGGIALNDALAQIGEAGPEAVVPLSGVQGRKAIDFFAEGLLSAASKKRQDMESASVVSEPLGMGDTYINIQFSDEYWQEKINKAIKNKNIVIEKGVLI